MGKLRQLGPQFLRSAPVTYVGQVFLQKGQGAEKGTLACRYFPMPGTGLWRPCHMTPAQFQVLDHGVYLTYVEAKAQTCHLLCLVSLG